MKDLEDHILVDHLLMAQGVCGGNFRDDLEL